jgi:hypothetical protein
MGLSDEQLRNAAIIYQVGRSMGLGTRDIQIGLITALVESNLINVHYGDRDSLGLFQQRPSAGWGTPEQVLNPEYAARAFFKHLVGLGQSRFQMDMGAAAQAVQRSAFPDRYATKIPLVRSVWPLVAKGAGEAPVSLDGGDYLANAADSLTQTTPTEDQMLGSTTTVDPGIPSASTMLGAWGMDSPQPIELPDPLTDGSQSLLSKGTNPLPIANIPGLMEPPYQPPAGGFPYQQGMDGWRQAVISAARGALGTPYVWGGENLQSGVDCSGLVMAAFAKAGINLPRISYQQANQGQRVGLKGLQPGDLVAWDNSPRNPGADHIAVYIGGGMIIEAPRPGLSVRLRRIGADLEGGWGVHLNF